MVSRAEYIEALKRERGFVEATHPDETAPERVSRLAKIDAELGQFGEKPARRGRPETA